MSDIRDLLLEGLTRRQKRAVSSKKRRLLVIAGAGSGKTEVMARRVAWWVAVEGVPKDAVAAFTFTERAAEEMKFRIRKHIARVTPPGEDSTLGGMYVGTIHAFCLKMLRELRPDVYYNFEVLDDVARLALVERGYYGLLGLTRLQSAWRKSKYETIGEFLKAYDLLNEYGELEVELPSETAPADPAGEGDWCRSARLLTDVGSENVARAFAESAARYYAYLRCRRFLDFSTSQSELLRLLRMDAAALETVRSRLTHVVVDEAQDLNPVQDELVRTIMGDGGTLTAVGDHRQAIYAWRGARVDLMAALYEELRAADDGDVVELEENFRSTPRIIELANRWADTIPPVRTLGNPEMRAGNDRRADLNPTHVAVVNFETRLQEAEWIAEKIATLVRRDGTGTFHDTRDGERGISYGDVAVLVRSSTDSRTYMEALERRGIPAVVRAGPDLFSQPEVLLFVAAFARAVGITEFFGSRHDPKSLPARIHSVFGCAPEPEPVLRKACAALRAAGLPLDVDLEDRLLLSADLMGRKLLLLDGPPPDGMEAKQLKSARLRDWLSDGSVVRRVFPQTLYHLLLEEAGVGGWETLPRGRMAMFHLGQLSSIIKGIETPGWTNPQDFKYQIIALCQSAARDARTEEAPLLVPPDAVTIATIHSVKGLEYAAVFLADVCPSRFPSSKARSVPELPFGGPILQRINPNRLADDENHDGERRLMYVALTRAERYLFVTCSGSRRSRFFREVEELVRRVGGTVGERDVPRGLRYLPSEIRREFRLTTSFTDLCYYLRCPHDFYLRKVLGFAPTISQAFGYGRGIHNLLREVHADPRKWARLARDPETLAAEVWGLIARGLFYLRYTTGEPAENMRRKAVGIVADYVRSYRKELARLEFVPEREFETLVEEEQVLISGAVDLVRLDDPPRVTLIDFKSGHAESDAALNLQEEEMRLQLAIYGLAARRELEYEPERGLVRYLGETDPARRELAVMLDDAALDGARRLIVDTVREIKRRNFESGPRNGDAAARCAECDFRGICGRAVRRHRRPRTRRRR